MVVVMRVWDILGRRNVTLGGAIPAIWLFSTTNGGVAIGVVVV